MSSILNGLILWAKAVLPALFPFFFLSKMLTELGSVKYISVLFEKFTQKVFRVNGIASYAFIMSIFSGYPVGAKITSELYENGYIQHSDIYKISSFCSTSGPLFIIGTVGVGMLFSKTAGIIIFISHILGAILNGVLWRNLNIKSNHYAQHSISQRAVSDDLLSQTITNSVISVAVVGGFISLFCMFVDVGIHTGILGVVANIISVPFSLFGIGTEYSLPFVTGLVEITRGSLEISKVALNPDCMIILITILISFGGVSTHLQSMAFLSKHKIKYSIFFVLKITQAILSAVMASIIVFFVQV